MNVLHIQYSVKYPNVNTPSSFIILTLHAQMHIKKYSSRNGSGSKWLLVHKVQEPLPKTQSRGVQKVYRLHPFATYSMSNTKL